MSFRFRFTFDIVSVNGISVCVEMILTLIRKIQLLLGSILFSSQVIFHQFSVVHQSSIKQKPTHRKAVAVKSHRAADDDEK